MTFTEIAKQRLHNQGIVGKEFKSAGDVVSWLGAIQAQEYAQAKWSLGLRLSTLKDSDVEKDFTKGKILRTHLLRPTWHFVTAQDIRWLLLLTAPRVNAANAYMYRQLELNNSIFGKANKILVKCLSGKNQLTRNEINDAFRKNKIMAEGHRLSYIMMKAELDGIICSGARKGSQFTYALLDERVPASNKKSVEEALAELTHRYFRSRGPATVHDFSTWSGLTLTDCRKGIASTTKLINARVGENNYFFYESPSSPKDQPGKMHLLPVYDEFIMGYKDRTPILKFMKGLEQKSTFAFDSTVVFDGQIIGTWKRTVNKKEIEVEHNFFKPLSRRQANAFEESIYRFEEFTGLKVTHK